MSEYRPYAIFLGIVGAGLIFAFFISAGYYPVAVIDGRMLTHHKLRTALAAASTYYTTVRETARRAPSPGEEISALTARDIEQVIFTELIENHIVHFALRKELGEDWNDVIENKVGKFDDDGELRIAARTLYRMTFDDFRAQILVPQAERDLLRGRLFLTGENFEEWLARAKKESRVRILSRQFYWDGSEVKAR